MSDSSFMPGLKGTPNLSFDLQRLVKRPGALSEPPGGKDLRRSRERTPTPDGRGRTPVVERGFTLLGNSSSPLAGFTKNPLRSPRLSL